MRIQQQSPAFFVSFLGIFCVWIWLNLELTLSPNNNHNLWERVEETMMAYPWPGQQEVKVYSQPKSNATVAICLIVRNESVYMDEWADFHIVSPILM